MFFLGLLVLAAIRPNEGQNICHAQQGRTNLTSQPGNAYIQLGTAQNGYPASIEYLMDINSTTGLTIRVVFGDQSGPFDTQSDENATMNICDILDEATDDPSSSPALYNIPEALGLASTRCPITKGSKVLTPYQLPTEFLTKNLSCGNIYYEMRVESPDQNLDTDAVMTLHVDASLTQDNETCTQSSSAILFAPSLISILGFTFFSLQL